MHMQHEMRGSENEWQHFVVAVDGDGIDGE
jgi:hypothetical protein